MKLRSVVSCVGDGSSLRWSSVVAGWYKALWSGRSTIDAAKSVVSEHKLTLGASISSFV